MTLSGSGETPGTVGKVRLKPEIGMHNFRLFLGMGNVTSALMVAPFGYESRLRDDLYHFRVTDGPHKGKTGTAPSLLDAVRKTFAPPTGASPNDR